MILTNDNYYSLEANRKYFSVSQYKQFMTCEAAAMAEIRGEWKQPTTTALLVGSYVDAWFEGTLEAFTKEHPEIFKKDGSLKADFVKAEEIIERVQADETYMYYMSGHKQTIMTRNLFGAPWKIKMDSYYPGHWITDGKVMRSLERIMGKSFVEHWRYDLQMAIYATVEGNDLETYIAPVTKEDPPDLDVIHVPKWRRAELLDEVEKSMPRLLAVKSGKVEPERCGVCAYCRATKKLIEPIDFELVGLSNAERKAIMGSI